MIVIPDASTVLKWVLPPANEPFAGQALAIAAGFAANRIELFVPADEKYIRAVAGKPNVMSLSTWQ